MGRLEGKTAVITGGASGMGAASVRRFVEEGASVWIADLQEDKGEALARELGDRCSFVPTNVGVEAEVKAMIQEAVDATGRIDCLFNNAGFGGVGGAIDEIEVAADYQRTIDGLLTGPLLGMKHAAGHMKAQGSGSIISTASVAGLRGGLGPHVYSAIKAAVIGLTQSVAVELSAFQVRVNAICPGGIMTPIFLGGRALKAGSNTALEDVLRPAFSTIQPIPRAGEGDDIAAMALFLASDESSFITGQAMVVDGGLTVGRRRDVDREGSPIQQALVDVIDDA